MTDHGCRNGAECVGHGMDCPEETRFIAKCVRQAMRAKRDGRHADALAFLGRAYSHADGYSDGDYAIRAYVKRQIGMR